MISRSIRNIYPKIPQCHKGIKWRPITREELKESRRENQLASNCYDEAVRFALISSDKGFEEISKRIKIQKNATVYQAYKFILNINGQERTFVSTEDNYTKLYKDLTSFYYFKGKKDPSAFFKPHKPRLSLAANIAIDKMLLDNPEQKPLITWLYPFPFFHYRFELNKPSNAFRWYTGKTPIIINETTLKNNLKSNRKEIVELFDKLGEISPKDYSFVAMSGFNWNKRILNWHCLPIIGIDKQNKQVHLADQRNLQKIKMTYDEFITKMKAVIGFNWLEK